MSVHAIIREDRRINGEKWCSLHVVVKPVSQLQNCINVEIQQTSLCMHIQVNSHVLQRQWDCMVDIHKNNAFNNTRTLEKDYHTCVYGNYYLQINNYIFYCVSQDFIRFIKNYQNSNPSLLLSCLDFY